MKHFLVDHLPSSKSTHRNWWRHLLDGLLGNDHEVDWIEPDGANVRGGDRAPRIFWVFTEQSLTPSLLGAVRREDVVLTWSGHELWREATPHAFMLGYPGEKWMDRYVAQGGAREDIITFQPYAPVRSLDWAPRASRMRSRPRRHDLAFFGTVWDANFDNFERILKPLADRHSYTYRGLVYDAPRWVRRYGLSRRQVSEDAGWAALTTGTVNVAISHHEHRRLESVTERVFLSAALGRPIVTDNRGVEHFFEPDEVRGFDNPDEYIEFVEWLLAHPDEAAAMAERAHARIERGYTYRNTVTEVLEQLSARLGV